MSLRSSRSAPSSGSPRDSCRGASLGCLQCCAARKLAALRTAMSATRCGQKFERTSRSERFGKDGHARAARWAWRFELVAVLTLKGGQWRGHTSQSDARVTQATLIAVAAGGASRGPATSKLKWLPVGRPRMICTAGTTVLEHPGSRGSHARCRPPLGRTGPTQEALRIKAGRHQRLRAPELGGAPRGPPHPSLC